MPTAASTGGTRRLKSPSPALSPSPNEAMPSYAKLMQKAGHPIVKPKPVPTEPDPAIADKIAGLMREVSALSEAVKRERGAIPLYFNLNRVWHALNAAQSCIPHAPVVKRGKPGCQYCH